MMLELIYLVGAIILWPVFAVQLVLSLDPYSGYDTEDYLFGAFFGFFAALFWPISLTFLGVSKIVRRLVEAQQEANR